MAQKTQSRKAPATANSAGTEAQREGLALASVAALGVADVDSVARAARAGRRASDLIELHAASPDAATAARAFVVRMAEAMRRGEFVFVRDCDAYAREFKRVLSGG